MVSEEGCISPKFSLDGIAWYGIATAPHAKALSSAGSRPNSLMNDSNIVTSPITAQASAFAALVDSLDVEEKWLHGVAVDWQTGLPTNEFTVPPTDTHCSDFAALVAKDVGIYLLQPPDHNPSPDDQEGQEYLANAQSFWLNGQYDPAGPNEPDPDDEEIDPDVITASQAGWANVATLLCSNASAYQLALEAQNLANAGFLVVASVLGNQHYIPGSNVPPPRGPGHIALIMPANLSQNDLTARGPAEAQAGDLNSSMTNIATGFNGHLLDPTSMMNSIAASTSYGSPMIQFFYNSNPLNVSAVPDSSQSPTS
jgi:hypothetical protein